jgi:5-methylcytosine-specific restriction endonuclease McrA
MYPLSDIQPAACREPVQVLQIKARGRLAPLLRRVIEFDPGPAYSRIAETADPLKRIQVRSNLSLLQLFPKKKDGFCDCGCGVALKGRQSRWAHPSCARFVWYVYAIIAGRRYEIRQCLNVLYGKACINCGVVPEPVKRGKGRGKLCSTLEFDHIIPVHRGGGACWLSNYRPLCAPCHKEKTGADRVARKAVSPAAVPRPVYVTVVPA